MRQFLQQSPWTRPGAYAGAIDAVPDTLGDLVETVQGLLLHGDHLDLYPVPAEELPPASRETLPLEARLGQILALNDAPLRQPRGYSQRAIGTCRDYALMTCGMLRQKGRPARVRCGFAGYFEPGVYADHWICEVWCAERGAWVRTDAQLDEIHREYLAIAFDACDLPRNAFLTANEAWRCYRDGTLAADRFGHGDATGAWFLWVNLARDYRALCGAETSEWDNWRVVLGSEPVLGERDFRRGDAIALAIEQVGAGAGKNPPLRLGPPFWLHHPAMT